MEWQAWGERLREVLELSRAPVSITYADQVPEGASRSKCRVCGALKHAADGEVIGLSTQDHIEAVAAFLEKREPVFTGK